MAGPIALITLIAVTPSASVAADAIEVGEFTATTGSAPYTQAVSHGLGETPDAILVWSTRQTSTGFSTQANLLMGVSDGTNDYCVTGGSRTGTSTSDGKTRIATSLLRFMNNSTTNFGEADLQSWNSTTFTLNWTTAASSTYRVQYLLIGGTGISANVKAWTSPTSTGDHSVTGVGFKPDVVIHLYSASVTSLDSNASNFDMGLGVMEATGDEWAFGLYSQDAENPPVCISGQQTNAALHDPDGGSPWREASYDSMDADGFTVNFNTVAFANYNISLSLSGVVAEAASFSKSTSGAPVSQAVNGHSFEPEAVFFASFQKAATGSAVEDAKVGLGASDGSTEGSIAIFDEDDVDPANTDRMNSTTKVFTMFDNDSASVDAEADLTSLDDDGFTLNWTTNEGTAIQICSLALVPFSAIAVRVEQVEASVRLDGVQLEWGTRGELDHLGFHVYRVDGAAETRLTPTLIPGAAFLSSTATPHRAQRRYSWGDPMGNPGSQYVIEDWDLDGTRTRHGPYTARFTGPFSFVSAPVSAVLPVPGLSSAVQLAVKTRRHVVSVTDSDTARRLAGRAALVIEVDQEDLYQVSAEDWIAAGLSPQVDPDRLRLYCDGQEVPLRVDAGLDGQFDPGDTVAFFGLGSDSPEDGSTYYWLVDEREGGRRFRPASTSTDPTELISSFRQSRLYQPRVQYAPSIRNGWEENFFGPLLSDVPTSIPIELASETVLNGAASVLVSLQGLGAGPRAIQIEADGVPIGVAQWSGPRLIEQRFSLPLDGPGRVIDITLLSSAPGEFALLKALQFDVQESFAVEGDRWFANVPESRRAVLRGIACDARLLDVTDPRNPFEIETTAAGPTVASSGHGERRWLVRRGARTPCSFRRNEPSRWRARTDGAEFVVVADRAFHPALGPLVEARCREGLSTWLVAVDDLFDEYTGGARRAEAVQMFLRDGAATWATPPRYLLLVGDATSDPKEYLSSAPAHSVPTVRIDAPRLETASDAGFGDLDDDGRLEIAVGRVPFSTVSEVEDWVRRTLAYERAGVQGRPFGAVVTDRDEGFPFAQAAARLASMAPGLAWLHHDRNVSDAGEVSAGLAASLSRGAAAIAYFGHGGTQSWGEDALWDVDRVGAMNGGHSPVVGMASCLNGYFHHASFESLAEAWLESPGGAIAVLASTDFSNPYAQRDLTLSWLAHVTSTGTPRFGDALLAAQFSTDPWTVRTTVLLGDPTARFSR